MYMTWIGTYVGANKELYNNVIESVVSLNIDTEQYDKITLDDLLRKQFLK